MNTLASRWDEYLKQCEADPALADKRDNIAWRHGWIPRWMIAEWLEKIDREALAEEQP